VRISRLSTVSSVGVEEDGCKPAGVDVSKLIEDSWVFPEASKEVAGCIPTDTWVESRVTDGVVYPFGSGIGV
jgi:hypothetical protein